MIGEAPSTKTGIDEWVFTLFEFNVVFFSIGFFGLYEFIQLGSGSHEIGQTEA